ncbi:MAG: hypothetical protein JNL54_19175, partial [Kineosporiaceae bacterium]|nr:hypothetical protein [Kineosporiaceae bacterium]
MTAPTARQINDTIRYTMWSVFAAAPLTDPVTGQRADRPGMVEEINQVLGTLEGKGLVVRGWYDVAGLR